DLALDKAPPIAPIGTLHGLRDDYRPSVFLAGDGGTEAWSLWEPTLEYLSICKYDGLQQLMEAEAGTAVGRTTVATTLPVGRGQNVKATVTLVREVCEPAKLFCLRWTFLSQGIKAARNLYKQLSNVKPVPLQFFFEYADMELAEPILAVQLLAVTSKFKSCPADVASLKRFQEIAPRQIPLNIHHPDRSRDSQGGGGGPGVACTCHVPAPCVRISSGAREHVRAEGVTALQREKSAVRAQLPAGLPVGFIRFGQTPSSPVLPISPQLSRSPSDPERHLAAEWP
ncbi:hypothetical protein BaRGS_00010262, partial [Batillaria attramentaria]